MVPMVGPDPAARIRSVRLPGWWVTSWTNGAAQTTTPAARPPTSQPPPVRTAERRRTMRPSIGATRQRATAGGPKAAWLWTTTVAVTTVSGHHRSRPVATARAVQNVGHQEQGGEPHVPHRVEDDLGTYEGEHQHAAGNRRRSPPPADSPRGLDGQGNGRHCGQHRAPLGTLGRVDPYRDGEDPALQRPGTEDGVGPHCNRHLVADQWRMGREDLVATQGQSGVVEQRAPPPGQLHDQEQRQREFGGQVAHHPQPDVRPGSRPLRPTGPVVRTPVDAGLGDVQDLGRARLHPGILAVAPRVQPPWGGRDRSS